MPRDYDRHRDRERSPRAHPTSDRKYRDRSSPPKRKASDFDDAAPSRKKIQLPARDNKFPSVNELKKRIRDVTRLLKRADLPADARIVQERALAGYEKELADEMKRRDRSKMIKKYHFVRFLDRKTATKEVNKLVRREQEISESEGDAGTKEKKLASVAAKLHLARVNLNYTVYYPLNEKYISIYPGKNSKTGSGDPNESGDDSDVDVDGDAKQKKEEKTAAEKKAMLQTVEKCMKDGTLDLLRDGKLSAGGEAADTNTRKSGGDKKKTKQSDAVQKSSKGKERAERSNTNADDRRGKSRKQVFFEPANNEPKNDDGDESDGGFFEM